MDQVLSGYGGEDRRAGINGIFRHVEMTYRFRGLNKDYKLIESNNIDDFRLQDLFWFEEISHISKEMYENLRQRIEIPYYDHPDLKCIRCANTLGKCKCKPLENPPVA